MSDLIVLAGCIGIEQAAKRSGYDVTVPFALDVWMLLKIRLM